MAVAIAQFTGDTTYSYGYSGTQQAQTFPVPAGYTRVAYFNLEILRLGTVSGSVTASLYATSGDLPTGSALASASITASTITTSAAGAWYTFDFGDVAVSPGGQYAIVISHGGTSASNTIAWRCSGSDAYGSGRGCYKYSGGSWVVYSSYARDFSFYVYGYGLPTGVAGSTASSVGSTSFYASSSVSGDNGATITSRGFCYSSVTSNPTLSHSVVTSGSSTGSFGATLTGMSPGVLYYFRSYATNAAGTTYGAVASQTTAATTPTVTTTSPATTVSYYTATVSGNVTNSGGATVTERGVCYNTTGTPTTSSSKGTTGSGLGAFSSNISGLTSNTTYYARAYAINSAGTSYGAQVSFKTLISVPTVTTSATIDNRTSSGGKVYGEVTASGGAAITERGFVYALTANPTTSNSKVTVAGTTGTMEYSLTGLTSGTLYYVRAFATNSEGTAYGANRSFTTLPGDPSALDVVVKGKTTGSLSWTRGTNGTYTIIRRQLNSPPANAASGTLVYNGTGTSTTATGMNAGGHYYFRAWASTTADGLTAVSASYTADDITTIADFIDADHAQVDDSSYATVTTNDGKLYAQVSKDGGATWSNARELTFTASIETLSFGTGITTLWDTTFTGADITDANLRVKLTGGSAGLSYQTYKTFGFSIDAGYTLTGLQVQVKAAYDASNILLYFVKVNPYYGTSPLPIGQGSVAYDSTADRITYYDGTGWKQVGITDDATKLLDWFYPVGTIYETTSTDLDTTTKMANHFGGTWESFGQGRVLVGKAGSGTFATAGATGGAETHTLTTTEMPTHGHTVMTDIVHSDGTEVTSEILNVGIFWGSGRRRYSNIVSNSGGGEAHNNLQPYIVVYRYRRTA